MTASGPPTREIRSGGVSEESLFMKAKCVERIEGDIRDYEDIGVTSLFFNMEYQIYSCHTLLRMYRIKRHMIQFQ